MQISLFDDHNRNRIDFQQCLSRFDLAGAEQVLDKWQKKLNAPSNLNQKREALSAFARFLKKERRQPQFALAELWLNYGTTPFLQPLRGEFRHLFNGINQALAGLLNNNDYDFLLPSLHPAQIFIQVEDYSKAQAVLEKYLNLGGEHSFIRQLLGAALWKAGNKKKALINYTMAFFNNPLQLSERYLYPGEFNNKYLFLREKSGDSEKAWLHLPFTLWQEGKTHVDPYAQRFESYLHDQIKNEQAGAHRSPSKKIIYFLHLLYLLEMRRLRYRSFRETEETKKWITEIKKLNPEWLNTYYGVLRTYHNF